MKKSLIVVFSFITINIFSSCTKIHTAFEQDKYLIKNEYNSMTEVFNSVNHIQIEALLKEKNEAQAFLILLPLSKKIISFISSTYKIDISNSTNLIGVIVVGALIAKKEQELILNNIKLKSRSTGIVIQTSPGMDCFITAVSSIIGISDARNLFLQFSNGVSAETILGTVKLMGKRVAGFVTIVFAIYELGQCIGWWEEISID